MRKGIAQASKSARKAAELTPNLLDEAAEYLGELLESVRVGGVHGDGEHESTIAAASQLAQAIKAITGEQRARQKLEIAQADALRVDIVVEWARGLPEVEYLHLMRALAELNEGGSVLG